MAATWKLCYFYEKDLQTAPALKENEIHIWYIPTESGVLLAQADILPPEEQERALRYKHAGTRKCYQVGHTALRLLLAHYLGVLYQELRFAYNEHGKPILENVKDVHFNISHSADWIALAFVRSVPIGVDIEFARDDRKTDPIVKRFFHPQEAKVYQALFEEQKREFFYERWTAREAALKALGIGLTVETNDFLVKEGQDLDRQSFCIEGGPPGSERLSLMALQCPEGYAGCVAAGMESEMFAEAGALCYAMK